MVDYGYLYGYGYEIYMMEFETPGFHIFKFKCSQIQVVLENKTDSDYLSTFSRQRRKVRAQLNLPQKRKLWIQERIHPTLKIEKSATKNVVP